MRNQGLIVTGFILITAGLMFLFGNLFDINMMAICFPLGLIILGFFLLIRPRMVPDGTRSDVLFIGDLERVAPWNVGNEELWTFVGDIKYDLTRANVPKGQSTIRCNGFVSDIEIIAPRDIGVTVHLSPVIGSLDTPAAGEEDYFLAPAVWQNSAANHSDRQVRFEFNQFVAEVSVREA